MMNLMNKSPVATSLITYMKKRTVRKITPEKKEHDEHTYDSLDLISNLSEHNCNNLDTLFEPLDNAVYSSYDQ